MRSFVLFSGPILSIAVLTAACGDDDTNGSGGQAASSGSGAAGSSSGGGGQGASAGSGGSGGTTGCLSCADALAELEAHHTGGKICEDPASTQSFLKVAQCYCGEAICGGAAGPCALVCDPEPDRDVSEECFDCIVTSFSGACKPVADECANDT